MDRDILIGGDDDAEDDESGGIVKRVYWTVFGTQREAFVCPDCEAACERSQTYDVNRAAFSGGESPSWYCGECDTHYVRESDDDVHTLDLYGRE